MADTGQKKEPTPATPSGAYERMRPRWALIDAVLGGTDTMRAATDTYLPQHPEESDKNYANRVKVATLFNATEMVLDALAGRPFSEPVKLGDDVPKDIVELCEDIDLLGNNLHRFCQEWFRVGWGKGLSHVLVDFPSAPPLAEGEVRTLADDRQENKRPYAIHIRPEALIAAYAETVDGKERLVHVRYFETTVERDGWEEQCIQKIRVLEPGTWELWAPVPKKEDEWFLEDSGVNDMSEITLVTFYAGKREGLMECKPPLYDLAHLNVTHFQSSSDQRNVLTVSRFPILAGAGVSADAKVTVGPNNYLATEDKEGKWYYVEHTGAAIEAGRKDLEDLEAKMAGYGAEFLRKRPGNEAVANRVLDSAEGASYLQATVLAFQDCVEAVLGYFADWLKKGEDGGGSVEVKSDFTDSEANPTEIDALLKMRAARDISRRAFLEEMIRRCVLREDFDIDEDEGYMQDEADQGMGDMFNPDGSPKKPGADPTDGETHPNGAPKYDDAGNELDDQGNPVDPAAGDE